MMSVCQDGWMVRSGLKGKLHHLSWEGTGRDTLSGHAEVQTLCPSPVVTFAYNVELLIAS